MQKRNTDESEMNTITKVNNMARNPFANDWEQLSKIVTPLNERIEKLERSRKHWERKFKRVQELYENQIEIADSYRAAIRELNRENIDLKDLVLYQHKLIKQND